MAGKAERYADFLQALERTKDTLRSAKRPFILYDDDPDGLSAFLLLYRWLREGKHYPVKTSPEVGLQLIGKIEEYGPDLVIVLDKPLMSEEFVDSVKVPIIWYDHHIKEKMRKGNLSEINPRDYGVEQCSTAHIMYDLVKDDRPEDIWIGMVGTVGDWTMARFAGEFRKRYPDLLPEALPVEEMLYASPIGELVELFSFLLKLQSKQYKRCLATLLKVSDPHQLLEHSTEDIQAMYAKVGPIAEEYKELIAEARKAPVKGHLKVFTYHALSNSFTKELSNELLYRCNEDTIIVGRIRNDQIKLSLRSHQLVLTGILAEALVGIRGHGGGHEHACGASMEAEDFPRFLESFARLHKEAYPK